MTRTFNEKIRCPKCGHEHTAETDFERWMRNCSDLDSRRKGIVRFDLDVLLHKYLIHEDGKGSRDIQCLMFVEVKTRMAKPSDSQRDTLSMLNQVLRNRRPNRHSKPYRQMDATVRKVRSTFLDKDVTLKMYGGHLLQLSDTMPDNSGVMRWDNWKITKHHLIELLTFARDPDRPNQMIDHRRRSRPWAKMPRLFE